MIQITSTIRIFVYTAATDMRKGFCGLSGLVKEHFEIDLFSGHLFVFFNRSGDKVKILFWDRSGFVVWYKRLEEGTFEKLPSPAGQMTLEIDIAKLTWILEGIDLFKSRCRKRYQRQSR